MSKLSVPKTIGLGLALLILCERLYPADLDNSERRITEAIGDRWQVEITEYRKEDDLWFVSRPPSSAADGGDASRGSGGWGLA